MLDKGHWVSIIVTSISGSIHWWMIRIFGLFYLTCYLCVKKHAMVVPLVP